MNSNNDLFEENNRLRIELNFVNKCLNVLNKININLNRILSSGLHSNGIQLTSDDIQIFEDLEEEYKEVLKDKPLDEVIGEENDDSFDKQITGFETNLQTIGSKTNLISEPMLTITNNVIKLWKCLTIGCNKVFITQDLLQKHFNNDHKSQTIILQITESEDNSFKCPNVRCNQLFTTEDALKEHMKCHLSQRIINSLKSNPNIGTNNKIKDKNREIISEKVINSYNCPDIKCRKRFESEESFKNHLNCHLSQRLINRPKNRNNEQNSNEKSIQLAINEISKNTSIKVWKCPETNCKEVLFLNEESLQQHLKRSHSKSGKSETNVKLILSRNTGNNSNKNKEISSKRWKCPLISCNQLFGSRESAKSHINSVHSMEPQFNCFLMDCKKSFYQKSAFNQHLRSHRFNGKAFVCEFQSCNYRTKKSHYFEAHINGHKGVKPYICPEEMCGNGFTSNHGLRAHIKKVHSLDRTFFCEFPDCLKGFKTKVNLNLHKRTHSNDRPYACPQQDCPLSFKCIESLKSHQLNHLKHRPFPCEVDGCGKSFAKRTLLRQHQTCHSTLFLYNCPIDGCEKRFKSETILKKHLVFHSNQWFRCDWLGCEFRTKWKSGLNGHKKRVHLKSHSFGQKFRCDWTDCGKEFIYKKYLEIHLRIHRNEKPFVCQSDGCHYRSVTRSNLKKHVKTHSKNQLIHKSLS